ncbi:putative G-patch domain protein, partial [Aspergillus aculeatinus CBS 121060]
EEEDYFLPLEDQRVFGAGIRRKRVPFVRSSDGPDLNTTDAALHRHAAASTAPSTTTGATIANKYLSIVLSKSATPTPEESTVDYPATAPSTTTTTTTTTNTPTTATAAAAASPQSHPAPTPPSTTTPPPLEHNNSNPTSQICQICNLPYTAASSSETQPAAETTPHPHPRPHEASLAHQLCLTHSHPPSHLDRTRPGLRYLAAYGWDPDSRLGLGAPGREGIVAPVKGKVKVDTVGLGGAGQASDEEGDHKRRRRGGGQDAGGTRGGGKVQKLNAKEVRRGQVDARKRGERLRELFYQDERVLRYLGGG